MLAPSSGPGDDRSERYADDKVDQFPFTVPYVLILPSGTVALLPLCILDQPNSSQEETNNQLLRRRPQWIRAYRSRPPRG